MATQIIVPDNALVMDIAIQARASHLYLISNGNRSVLSPIVPAGWKILIDPSSKRAAMTLDASHV